MEGALLLLGTFFVTYQTSTAFYIECAESYQFIRHKNTLDGEARKCQLLYFQHAKNLALNYQINETIVNINLII